MYVNRLFLEKYSSKIEMSFRPIPELPKGFTLNKSTSRNIYYYFNSNTADALWLSAVDPFYVPEGWVLSDGGAQGPMYYNDKLGISLPFYPDLVEYEAAIADWFIRHPPASIAVPSAPTGGTGAPMTGATNFRLAGRMRTRENNASNSKQENFTRGVKSSKKNWSDICKEEVRDQRHVTVVIHNTDNNTFLIGNENNN